MNMRWRVTLRHTAFLATAALVALAYLALIWRQIHYGLEFDESYHLTVVRNLANGAGYTDDGVSFDTAGIAFAPTIAVGPTLLVPSAVAWKLSSGSLEITRLVPIAFLLVYLASAVLIFLRWGGRWAAVAAAAGPLMLPVLSPDLLNRSLMPGRFVGETAAAACLMLSVLLMSRRRYLLAGLAGGLAVQAKLNFALPALVVIGVYLLSNWVARREATWRIASRSLLGVVVPTAAFELVAWAVLGSTGYSERLQLTQEFLANQTPTLEQTWHLILRKFSSLAQLASGAGVVLTLAAVSVLAYVILTLAYTKQIRMRTDWGAAVGVAALSLAAMSNLLWWYFRAAQISSRAAVPSIMIMLTVLAALAAFGAQTTFRAAEGRMRALSAAVAVTYVGVLVACVGYQGWRIVNETSGAELLASQRAAAVVLRSETGWVPVDSFWTNPEMSVLTGLSPEKYQLEKTRVLVFTSVRAVAERGVPDAQLYLDRCSEVLMRSPSVVVCQPR